MEDQPSPANQNPEVPEVTLETYRQMVAATENANAQFQNQLLIISNLEEKLKEKAQKDKEVLSKLEADLKNAEILYETELNGKKNSMKLFDKERKQLQLKITIMKELESEKREMWNTRKDLEKSYEEEIKKLKDELEKLETPIKEANNDRRWDLNKKKREIELQWYQDGFQKIGDIFKTKGNGAEEKYKKMMEKLVEIQDKYRTRIVLTSSSNPEPSSSNQTEKSVHMGHNMARKKQMIAKKKYQKLKKNIRLYKKNLVQKMNIIRVNQKREVRRLKAEVEKANEAKREIEEAWEEEKAKMEEDDGYFDSFGGKNGPPLGNLMKAMCRAQDLNIKLRKKEQKSAKELQYLKDGFRTIMDIVNSKNIDKEEKFNQMALKLIEIQEKQGGVPSTSGPPKAKRRKR
ncbi:hypothetical protein B9Z55_007344 [Caenorhabditis nigoni]|uniref:Uncharacterized protein n=1 Tax=Caenorhabditis nigoni TaxID=1611254 RepID=A0A2G5V9K0_9PELO|nr:hypothetical protein B9Z55_007344 [Caenorhabditis nigoni]